MPTHLGSAHELEPLLRQLARAGFDGEIVAKGHSRAHLCLFAGRIAWLDSEDYPEHFADVLRRELGLSGSQLRDAISHCRATGLRFTEGMEQLRLACPEELRDALRRHLDDQLLELLQWAGPLTLRYEPGRYRYDASITFSLDELLARPARPTPEERRWLDALTRDCRARLPRLKLACVVEGEEGSVLSSSLCADPKVEDLMGLCLAGLRRLARNRVSLRAPSDVVLVAEANSVLVRRLSRGRSWLLVLAARTSTGRLLSVAGSSIAGAEHLAQGGLRPPTASP